MLKFLSSIAFSIYSYLRLMYWYGEGLFRTIIPPPMASLDGETILVTGAAGGIGSALCRYLVSSSKNLKLVMWGTNRKGMEELAKELEQQKGSSVRCYVYTVDISSKENIQSTATLVKNDVGPVTVIINNAGVSPLGKFLELTEPEIERTLRINLDAQIWILREFLGSMMASNQGRIVNVCTVGGFSALPCFLPYIASKFGMNGSTEALKAELDYFGYDGIRITTAFPGWTRTPMMKSVDLDKKGGPPGMPASMGRLMEPEYVAKRIVDGMRRGQEFVYAPPFVGVLPYAEMLVPAKQRRFWKKMTTDSIVPSDPTEAKVFRDGHRIKEV